MTVWSISIIDGAASPKRNLCASCVSPVQLVFATKKDAKHYYYSKSKISKNSYPFLPIWWQYKSIAHIHHKNGSETSPRNV
jgi:hypothetical protein